MKRWFGTAAVSVLLAVGGLAAACGDDDGSVDEQTTAVVEDSGSVSNSSVAPNTFLTFQGERFKLEGLEQANLAASNDAYDEIGTASQADIDQADLTVYRKDDDDGAVYTYAAAQGEGDEATPAFWYRWVPEP